MIDPTWKRIAGIHIEDDGTLGAVWIAHDTTSDLTYLYDAFKTNRAEFAVIAEGINARGPWIPIAWDKKGKEFSDKLLNLGLNMLHDASPGSQASAEVITREIWQRMDTGRFVIKPVAGQWKEENISFYQQRSMVPLEGFPLMSATRHAIELLSWAKRQSTKGSTKVLYPKINII